MGVIFDSCVWVALASGQMERQTVIAAVGATTPVFASVISLGELAFGVHVCADPAARALRAAWLRQVERRPILPVTQHTAAAFGVLCSHETGWPLTPRPRYNDLWIAAQAIEHGHTLLTLNASNHAGLPGLLLAVLDASRQTQLATRLPDIP